MVVHVLYAVTGYLKFSSNISFYVSLILNTVSLHCLEPLCELPSRLVRDLVMIEQAHVLLLGLCMNTISEEGHTCAVRNS